MPKGERPGWMLNVTNDAWFGISSGTYQHLQQAKVRAIEEGLPLVRAANTASRPSSTRSAVLLPRPPLGVEGVLDTCPLPNVIVPTLSFPTAGITRLSHFHGRVLIAAR